MRTFRGVILAILVVVTPLVLASPALAQNNPPPQQDTDSGVGFGVLAGLTSSKAKVEGVDVGDSQKGAMFGIWFGGNRNGRVGFMGELSYVRKAGFGDDKLHYLEIPAVFRINIGSRSRNGVSVYGIVGPVIDIKLKQPDSDIVGNYEGFDLGLMFGGGVEVTRIGAEVRVNRGLRSIYDPGDSGISIKTTTIQVLVKFRIN